MIKRVVGIVFTIAVFAVVLVAALNFGNYRSFVFDHEEEPRDGVEAEVPETDSLVVEKIEKK